MGERNGDIKAEVSNLSPQPRLRDPKVQRLGYVMLCNESQFTRPTIRTTLIIDDRDYK